MSFDHFYRWKKYKSPFAGKRCRVLARGKLNSVLVEFEGGEKAVVSRYAIRKAAA